MATEKKSHRKPAIVVTHSDHERLSRLAEAHMARNPEVSEELLVELDRARIVPDNKIGSDVVRMGSTLHFVSDLGDERLVMLVFPGEANIAAGKVSVLTPIGAALIGLSTGQSIDWTSRDGRVHRLTVERVEALAAGFPASKGTVEVRSAS
ncbi:nucleoside diphosphate kinase regulator [Rhizobium sp. 18065]|uniref:nucleoside diphosphate kinase regulator n=1 Tax=Rhizobium sp. 18065 TaxID=2681411 RepID=UPI00135B74F1|nr:nucleoside diphosphate kinase regulator [Rhizobium sp. 18065]